MHWVRFKHGNDFAGNQRTARNDQRLPRTLNIAGGRSNPKDFVGRNGTPGHYTFAVLGPDIVAVLLAAILGYVGLSGTVANFVLALFRKSKHGKSQGNTDDHAKNHAAFWNGKDLNLTPACDNCPQSRPGGVATQAMLIMGEERASQIALCLKSAPLFLLNEAEAILIASNQIKTIKDRWSKVCDEAKLAEVDRNFLWRRQFLNSYAFIGAPEPITKMV